MSNAFPHGYALLIGVGASAYTPWSLPVTVKDVQALRAVLTDPTLCGYPADHIRLLHDAGATRQAILDGLGWLARQVAADGDATAVVYFSGHGWLNEATGRYYLIPHDVEPFNLAGSALAAETFTEALRKVSARRLLVLMDCCHAAGMATAKEAPAFKVPPDFSQTALPKGVAEALKQGAGRAVISSSTGAQKSLVRPDERMSLFTYHLLEALQGAGNRPGDREVRLSNLMAHLSRAVPESAHALGAEQTPFLDAATEDFPVALVRGGKGLPEGGWERVEQLRAVVLPLGDRSVAVGGDVSGSVIVTGDGNTVSAGKYNGRRGAPSKKSGRRITLIEVESSMVHAVGYDEEHRCLEVVFNTGRIYCYEGVPPEVFQGLLEAESKGRFMLAHIIDVYPYRRGPCRQR